MGLLAGPLRARHGGFRLTALVATLVRAELRPARLAALAAALGVLVAAALVVEDPRRPRGPFFVITGSATGLRYGGVVLIALGAWLQVRRVEQGLQRDLFLAGLAPTRQRRASALAGALVGVLLWGTASAVAAAAGWLADGGVAGTRPGSAGVAATVAIAVGTAVMLTVVGSACGSFAATRTGAVTGVAVLVGLPILLALCGRYPPALTLKALFPTEAVRSMLEPPEGVRGGSALRWGVPAAWLVLASGLVAFGRRSFDPGHITRDVAADAPQGRRGGYALAVVVLVVSVVALGALVPQRLARTIPWWLRGQWLSDLALHRDSKPVAEAYVSAVLRGDRTQERRLLAGDGMRMDPQLRLDVRRAGRVRSVRYAYTEGTRPGTVLVSFGGNADLTLTVCADRVAARWRVTRTTSGEPC